MADLSRLYDFTAGQVIRSSEVDAEFNQLIARINDMPEEALSSSLSVYTAYRTLLVASGFHTAPGFAGPGILNNGSLFSGNWSGSNSVGGMIYFDDADYTATGRTPKLRVRAQLFTNATAPANTYTVGLYPISSVAGIANAVTPTLGAVVSGSTVGFASQAASTRGQGDSGQFTVPADGYYVLGAAMSGAPAANAAVAIFAQLQLAYT